MKFAFGSVPAAFFPDASWTLFREPKLDEYAQLASPLSLFLPLLFCMMWLTGIQNIHPGNSFQTLIQSLGDTQIHTLTKLTLIFLLTVPATVLLHELVHGLAHPKFGLSDFSVYGIQPSKHMLFVVYLESLTKPRLIFCLSAPFFVLSVLPLVALEQVTHYFALGFESQFVLMIVSIINSFLSSMDLYIAAYMSRTLPHGAIVQSRGSESFWKLPVQAEGV